MKKAVVEALKAIYIVAAVSWFFLACVQRIAGTSSGIAALNLIMLIGFGAWILQNYFQWRWEL